MIFFAVVAAVVSAVVLIILKCGSSSSLSLWDFSQMMFALLSFPFSLSLSNTHNLSFPHFRRNGQILLQQINYCKKTERKSNNVKSVVLNLFWLAAHFIRKFFAAHQKLRKF
jgi:hypothetical protein